MQLRHLLTICGRYGMNLVPSVVRLRPVVSRPPHAFDVSFFLFDVSSGCSHSQSNVHHIFYLAADKEIDAWRGDLLDTVEGFLNSVMATKNEASLVDLFARQVGLNGVVNACLVTEIMYTLSCYRYSQSARTTIQSFLSEFPLLEVGF